MEMQKIDKIEVSLVVGDGRPRFEGLTEKTELVKEVYKDLSTLESSEENRQALKKFRAAMNKQISEFKSYVSIEKKKYFELVDEQAKDYLGSLQAVSDSVNSIVTKQEQEIKDGKRAELESWFERELAGNTDLSFSDVFDYRFSNLTADIEQSKEKLSSRVSAYNRLSKMYDKDKFSLLLGLGRCDWDLAKAMDYYDAMEKSKGQAKAENHAPKTLGVKIEASRLAEVVAYLDKSGIYYEV